MIDFNKIIHDVNNENFQQILAEKQNPSKDNVSNEERMMELLMLYSTRLLKHYHHALQAELLKHEIQI